jgi:hypothetical protein
MRLINNNYALWVDEVWDPQAGEEAIAVTTVVLFEPFGD